MATVVDPLQSTAISRDATNERAAMLDFARLGAALAVVWLHTPRSESLAEMTTWTRFAVPFFSAAAAFLVTTAARRSPQRSLREYAQGRLRRVYAPFVAWSLIYLAFKWLKWRALPDQPNSFNWPEICLFGAAYHLWYLPYILAASVLLFVVARLTVVKTRPRFVAIVLASVGLFIAVSGPVVDPVAIVAPSDAVDVWSLPEWRFIWNALPATLWGACLGLVGHQSSLGGQRVNVDRRALNSFVWAAFALMIAALSIWGRQTTLENLAGATLLMAAIRDPNTPALGRFIQILAERCGKLAMGIYLSHFLILKTAESIAAKCHTPVTPSLDLAIFSLAAMGGAALAWTLSQRRATRWLVA